MPPDVLKTIDVSVSYLGLGGLGLLAAPETALRLLGSTAAYLTTAGLVADRR